MPYTTQQAADRCKVTRKQIQDWIRKGLLRPPMLRLSERGHSVRLWGSRDLAAIKRIKKANSRKTKRKSR